MSVDVWLHPAMQTQDPGLPLIITPQPELNVLDLSLKNSHSLLFSLDYFEGNREKDVFENKSVVRVELEFNY